MSVQVMLSEYIKKLKAEESVRPVHLRRHVPTIRELVEASGTTESNYYKFLRNDQKDINRHYINSSIGLLRIRGFDVQLCDIIKYELERDND